MSPEDAAPTGTGAPARAEAGAEARDALTPADDGTDVRNALTPADDGAAAAPGAALPFGDVYLAARRGSGRVVADWQLPGARAVVFDWDGQRELDAVGDPAQIGRLMADLDAGRRDVAGHSAPAGIRYAHLPRAAVGASGLLAESHHPGRMRVARSWGDWQWMYLDAFTVPVV